MALAVLAWTASAPARAEAVVEDSAPRVVVPMSAAAPAVPPQSGPLGDAAQKPKEFEFKVDAQPGPGGKDGASIGVSGGLAEGKPLEVMMWGGSGAVAGALAGPFGAAVGGVVGAACGLVYSVFIVPHNGPERK